MKKIILILFLMTTSFAYAGDYEPETIFSKVEQGNIETVEQANYIRWMLEQIRVGFVDDSKLSGKTWDVHALLSKTGASWESCAEALGYELHSSGLFFSYPTQTVAFNRDGTYETSDRQMFTTYGYCYNVASEESELVSGHGKWALVQNRLFLETEVNFSGTGVWKRGFSGMIVKKNDYEFNVTFSEGQPAVVTTLYFSLPKAPPDVPINLRIEGSESQSARSSSIASGSSISITWDDQSNNEDGFRVEHRVDALDIAGNVTSYGTWERTDLAEDATECDFTLTEPGKHLFRVQSFRDVDSDIVYSPLGGGNTLAVIVE